MAPANEAIITAPPDPNCSCHAYTADKRLCLECPVMPVRNDVDRANRFALPACHARAQHRPRYIRRQGIQPNVDKAARAFARVALEAAGDVPLGEPFAWASERPSVFRS